MSFEEIRNQISEWQRVCCVDGTTRLLLTMWENEIQDVHGNFWQVEKENRVINRAWESTTGEGDKIWYFDMGDRESNRVTMFMKFIDVAICEFSGNLRLRWEFKVYTCGAFTSVKASTSTSRLRDETFKDFPVLFWKVFLLRSSEHARLIFLAGHKKNGVNNNKASKSAT